MLLISIIAHSIDLLFLQKDLTLMGVFPSTPPSTEVETVNMISMTNHNPRGKEVVDSSSLFPYEALYDVI